MILSIILAFAGWLRFIDLGRLTMGADTMEYYKICLSGVSASDIYLNSADILHGMPPFWFAAHNFILQLFSLPVSFATVRAPDAFVGILTVLCAYFLGREMKDKRCGLTAAFFTAVQPMLIQMSRECYFYAPIVLGCMLGTWTIIRLSVRTSAKQSPLVSDYILYALSLFLLTHVQISSWALAAVFVVSGVGGVLRSALKRDLTWWPAIIICTLTAFIGIFTLLFEWGMADVLNLMFGEGKEQWGNIFESAKENSFVTAWSIVSAYLFGRGWLRNTVNVVVLALGIFALVRGWKDARYRIFTYFTVGAVLFLGFIHTLSVFPPTPRHFSSIVPMLVVLVSLGIVNGCDVLLAKMRKPQLGFLLPVGGALLLFLSLNGWAAWLSTRLTGQPPYNVVAAWADKNLPKGTVILCDRWFTPWNEFRMHPTTNVSFTYTVPNEPPQVYSQVNWRETAKQFFAMNPSAAFYEGREYWVELGPWEWPHSYFARSEVFYDAAGIALDRMGLHYRPMPSNYPREWLPVTIYYNTEEDIIEKARAAGRRTLVTFGEGWQYTKTQDHRGWHVLPQQAVLKVYNLTDQPLDVDLLLAGTAVNGTRSLSAAPGVSATFQANRMQEVALGPLTLQPGRNDITCRSGGAGEQVPLLIYQAATRERP
jgi:hypothetical protein